jgi:thiol:disulfide interchange protein
MRQFLIVALLFCFGSCWMGMGMAVAAEGVFAKNGVSVVLSLERSGSSSEATIVGVFTPDPRHPQPLHIYGLSLPVGGPGIATRIALPADSPLRVRGPLTADQATHDLAGLQVFPEGPVTLRLPVHLPSGNDPSLAITVLIDYLACTHDSCLIPVLRGKVTLTVPTVAGGAVPTVPTVATVVTVAGGVAATPVAEAPKPPLSAEEVRAIIADELARQAPKVDQGIAWRQPRTVAEVEALLAEAARAGTPALLDFTGPSCLNCQVMEKTVFRHPEVRQALSRLLAIKVDTDPPHDELAAWQQQRFQSQNRPLYVLITGPAAKPKEERWSQVFAPGDQPKLSRFLAFLGGGAGADGNGGGSFWLLALLGGLFTLLMPCTYPMIPFTVNFFAKQAAAGKRLLPLALFYGAGIVVCFVGLGVLITGVFGANLATVAGHPLTNLVIAGFFVLFGLSLLGVFLLQVPLMSGSRGGYLGALVMGLTFAITAFSCTAPFAGSVLAAAVATGTWLTAVAGMTVYSLAIAVPFIALALSPGVLRKLPKAGAWMNELKVVGGLIEIAAALKFLVIADYAWGWGIFGRTVTLISWSTISVAIAIYVLGWIRWDGDEPIRSVGAGRLSLALAFAGLGLFFAAGLVGNSLGAFEGLFPGDR